MTTVALRCHQSQLEMIQYDEAVEGLNRYRVMSGQGQYCEAFQVIKIEVRCAKSCRC